MKIYQGKNLAKFPQLIHGFSGRVAGNLSLKRGKPSEVVPNREKFLASLGVNLDRLVAMECVHNDRIYSASEIDWGRGAYSRRDSVKGVDALVATRPGVFLFATFADCLPIFLFQPQKKLVGLIHAGWRGLIKKIVSKTIMDLVTKFNLDPSNLLVFIGPSIHVCCFKVDGEAAKQLAGRVESCFVDLQKICVSQLEEAGVKKNNIEISPQCTACDRANFYSHRISGTARGAMGAVIGLSSFSPT